MRMRTIGTSLVVVVLAAIGAHAQLVAPGDSGVAMGHLHLTVRDVDASKAFWTAVGGVPVQNGNLQLIQFPGTFVMLRRGEPTGGTVGSTVNHVGFHVKNLKEGIAKFEAAGAKPEPNATATQVYLTGPDDLRIELIEEASTAVPMRMHHIHFNTASATDTQAWYAKTFGAKPGKRLTFDAADLPGVNLTFVKADAAVVGTKGRVLDHIGFEVKNLEEFCKKLEASGVKLDRPYTKLPNSATAIAFLTDPWGTYIELTENLGPK